MIPGLLSPYIARSPRRLERFLLRARGYLTLSEARAFACGELRARKVGIGLEVDIPLVKNGCPEGDGSWHLAPAGPRRGSGSAILRQEEGDWYVNPVALLVEHVRNRRGSSRERAPA